MSDDAESNEVPPEPADQPATPELGVDQLLRGTPVAPGLVLGRVHMKDYDLSRAPAQRVPLDQVENQLNRFHKALVDARTELTDLKSRLIGQVPEDDARILDTHVAYLKDSVFISDVENLILNEQFTLEAAIGKVITDFDRIFRLVQSETLRERAVDLRDVAIRILRQLEQEHPNGDEEPLRPSDYVLVARELSIVDMFNPDGDRVQGVLTEEGGMTSHAAIFARSMGIPTITGIEGLLELVREGDFVIIDSSEGVVRINPEDWVREQYREVSQENAGVRVPDVTPDWARESARTVDGERIRVVAACGNLPEASQAVALGLESIGLYRTELMYLIDKDTPSREALYQHYAAVLEAAAGPVTFRLLDANSSMELAYLHQNREQNPALGFAGVRVLLANEPILRRQLQALLQAGAEGPARIAIPFVTDLGDFRRVREILVEERLEMRKAGLPFREKVDLGVILETPAAMLGVQDFAREADFLMVGLDALVQYVLAADRENHELAEYFENIHPYVLRAIGSMLEVCAELSKPLSLFGVTAVQAHNLPYLVGLGARDFCVDPLQLEGFLREIRRIDLREAKQAALAAAAGSSRADTLVDGYRRGYARP